MTSRSDAATSWDLVHAGPSDLALAQNELPPGENVSSFESDGYIVAPKVFDDASLDIYAAYALMRKAHNSFRQREEEKAGFHDLYADTLMESILLHLRPVIEKITHLSLLPTYSYLRIYETGAVLNKHRDRRACEISASLTLAYDAPAIWPLWLEIHGQPRSVMLRRGDMLVYKGRDLPHWRERFEGNYWIQAFFHYVDANGPLVSHKFDGRRGIGWPAE